MTTVGFVGAGPMGAPMVARLLAAGHDVRVHSPGSQTPAALREQGATLVDSGRAAALGADVVLVCLDDDDQLRAACAGADGVLDGLDPGAVLASHVTGRPETIRTIADATAAGVVDAPISGSADDIGNGELTVLLGGPAAAVATVAEVVGAYASTMMPIGTLGSALAAKLVDDLLFAAHAQLAADAAALGSRLGIDRDSLLRAVTACSGASHAAGLLARFPDDVAFGELVGPSLRRHIAVATIELTSLGVDAGLLGRTVRDGRLPLHDPLLG